jgi:uncharacterized protein
MRNASDDQRSAGAAYMNPYVAGVILGLTLLASYLIVGAGLGASAGIARLGAALESCVAPVHVAASAYFGQWGEDPLAYYLVFMLGGTFLGGLFSALLAGRTKIMVEKGRAASTRLRLVLALIGGILVGFASRLAGGCTSGQALSGGAMLLSGSLLFMVSLFASGYASAWLVRRQWDD